MYISISIYIWMTSRSNERFRAHIFKIHQIHTETTGFQQLNRNHRLSDVRLKKKKQKHKKKPFLTGLTTFPKNVFCHLLSTCSSKIAAENSLLEIPGVNINEKLTEIYKELLFCARNCENI